ncbi:MAG: hypothetical protein R6U32_04675 [Candidatus Woesearchaeota archaeon]
MKESLEKAREELKRSDHLIYVSLKYTRTCDVFKSIIERLINAMDFMIEALLKKEAEDNNIEEIPPQPIAKCKLCADTTGNDEIKEMCDFFLTLKKISRAGFTREREYRRHVTMRMDIEGTECSVDIDTITEYYKRTQHYYDMIQALLTGDE